MWLHHGGPSRGGRALPRVCPRAHRRGEPAQVARPRPHLAAVRMGGVQGPADGGLVGRRLELIDPDETPARPQPEQAIVLHMAPAFGRPPATGAFDGIPNAYDSS